MCFHTIVWGRSNQTETTQELPRSGTAKLAQLKSQIVGLTGEELAQKPEVALQLHSACSLLRREIMDESSLSSLTGRLKRRVVLD